MAKARLYVLNQVPAKAAELKGQAAVVFNALKAQNGEPKLASDIAAQVAEAGTLKTRQDVLRVVLYYIIVFKGRGWVSSCDQELPAPTGDAQLREHDEYLVGVGNLAAE